MLVLIHIGLFLVLMPILCSSVRSRLEIEDICLILVLLLGKLV
jgi:hypothetical protein